MVGQFCFLATRSFCLNAKAYLYPVMKVLTVLWVSLLLLLTETKGQFNPDFRWSEGWQEVVLPKLQPTMLTHPHTPGLAVGVEIRPIRSISVQAEYTLPFYGLQFYSNNFGKLGHDFFRLRSELRFYPNPADDREWYFALEGNYTTENYYRENSSFIRNEKPYSYIRSDITLIRAGGALKAGYQFTVTDWLLVDVFVGIGGRQKQVNHAPVGLFELPVLRDPEREGGDIAEGTTVGLYMVAGARLGFSLYPRY